MAERRLPPLGNTFINEPNEAPTAIVRACSYSGYIPHRLGQGLVVREAGGGRSPPSPRSRPAASPGLVPAGASVEPHARPPAPVAGRGRPQRWSDFEAEDDGDDDAECCGSSSTRSTEHCEDLGGSDTDVAASSTEAQEHAAEANEGTDFNAAGTAQEELGTDTTLMLRNLPFDVAQSDLLREMDKSGFKGDYDFVYMPSCFSSRNTKGYAFVNFITPAAAQRFTEAWKRTQPFRKTRDMLISICPATTQGRDANIRRWDNPRIQRIKNPKFRPLVLGASPEDAAAAPRGPARPTRGQGGVAPRPAGSCRGPRSWRPRV